jgi:hypothetical protein
MHRASRPRGKALALVAGGVLSAVAAPIGDPARSHTSGPGHEVAMPEAHRQITRRDARPEGEPDVEPSAEQLSEKENAMKDTQRDLTSLSGPLLDEKD